MQCFTSFWEQIKRLKITPRVESKMNIHCKIWIKTFISEKSANNDNLIVNYWVHTVHT